MSTTRTAHRQATALVVALAAVSAACGSSAADDAGEPADLPAATTSGPDTSEEPPESTAAPTSALSDESDSATDSAAGSDTGEATDDRASGPPPRENYEVLALPAGPAEFPVLGGIEFELPEAARALQTSGCVLIEQPGYAGGSPFSPYVVVAGVVASGANSPVPISTIDEWIGLYDGRPEPTPNGETLNALGLELEGYNIEGAYLDGPPTDNRFLNCSAEAGTVASLAFLPGGHGELYIAETDDALVIVAADAFTEDEMEGVRPMFDQIASTLQSTGT